LTSLFCRHNRFTADCPICSKGTVLEERKGSQGGRSRAASPARAGTGRGGKRADATPPQFTGPYVAAGPYSRGEGGSAEVRLERVPGGIRLAEWTAAGLERRAPVLPAEDLTALFASAGERDLIGERDAAALAAALARAGAGGAGPPGAEGDPSGADRDPSGAERDPSGAERGPPGDPGDESFGASGGRAGELRDELRVERLENGALRVARWVLRPNAGWNLHDAPPMLPAERFAEALASAARRGILQPA
jgi:hypothetical protein